VTCPSYSDPAVAVPDGSSQTLWYWPGCRRHLRCIESQVWAHRSRSVQLRRDPKASLRKHTTVLERLAQVAYGDLPADGRQILALDAFLQAINNMSLKRHLLVAEVETMERALRLGNAYFQADSTCWPGMAVQQVEADDDNVLPSLATRLHTWPQRQPTSRPASAQAWFKSCWPKSGISADSRQLSAPLGRRQLLSAGAPLYVGVVIVVGIS